MESDDLQYSLKDVLFSEHMKDVMPDTMEAMKDMASYVVPTTPKELALSLATGPIIGKLGKVVSKFPLPKKAKDLQRLLDKINDEQWAGTLPQARWEELYGEIKPALIAANKAENAHKTLPVWKDVVEFKKGTKLKIDEAGYKGLAEVVDSVPEVYEDGTRLLPVVKLPDGKLLKIYYTEEGKDIAPRILEVYKPRPVK